MPLGSESQGGKMSRESVKIINAALDEWNGNIVLRGIIDPDSLEKLQVAAYQREVLPSATINSLVKALEGGGRFPDIELGVRGANYSERDGNFYLSDEVFIIDGLQRTSAGQAFMKIGEGRVPHIGALIHFGTTEQWERERFRVLNQERTKLSPSIMIRNQREEVPAIDMLYRLCDDKQFVMQGKVCWTQQMHRGQLITTRTFCETVGVMHSHIAPGGRGHDVKTMANGLQKIMEVVGRTTMRDNIKLMFDVIDQCWGIRTVAFKEGAVWLRSNFLVCLADVLSMHQDFWRDHRLFVEADLVRKIKLFPITDPYIKELSGARGAAATILRGMLIEHINSGKRTRHLRPWKRSEVFVDKEVVEKSAEAVSGK